MVFFSSSIVPNSYATTGNRTHGRVVPDWDLRRTLYQLSYTAAARLLDLAFKLLVQSPCMLFCTFFEAFCFPDNNLEILDPNEDKFYDWAVKT